MAESQPSTSTTKTEKSKGQSRTETVVVEKCDDEKQDTPVLHLCLQKPKNAHKVKWSTETVDNEFMGKKKSKCCCIYEKPKVFGESDSSSSDGSDDEGCTPHCRGHKKKCYRHKPPDHNHDADDAGSCQSGKNYDLGPAV